MKTTAHIISVLFHPLLVTSYLLLILNFYFPVFLSFSPGNFKIILAFVFCFSFLLPVVNILMFRHFGTIRSYSMPTRSERIVPFMAITAIYVVMAYLFFTKLPIGTNFNKLIAIVAAMVLISALITLFYKVSVHSLAAGGLIGILIPLNKALENGALLWPTAWVMCIAGLVMSARLYLNAHTPDQVYSGAVAGFLTGFMGVILLF